MEPDYVLINSVWVKAGVDDPDVVTVTGIDYQNDRVQYEGKDLRFVCPIPEFKSSFTPAVLLLKINIKWRHRAKGYIVNVSSLSKDCVSYYFEDPTATGQSGIICYNIAKFITEFEPANFTTSSHKTTVKAWELCDLANKTMQERGAQYDKDDKQEERSIGKVVQFFNTLKGTNLTEEDGWLFMAILKIVRSQQGDYRPDSYVDLVAYAALMGEAASNERK